MSRQYLRITWACSHTESIETAGWKDCPTCMQERITDLEESCMNQAFSIHKYIKMITRMRELKSFEVAGHQYIIDGEHKDML